MKTYLVTLEPLETRYTAQWKRWIPRIFEEKGLDTYEIDGDLTKAKTSSRDFLDFYNTNKWKSQQIIKIADLFSQNKIKENDIFFHYDSWNYAVIAIKYMSALKGPKVRQYGIWHAGSYDPHDLLGLAGTNPFFKGFEESIFSCLEKSFVATYYHKSLILDQFKKINPGKIIVSGLPYDFSYLEFIPVNKKENIFVFPHRTSCEKQVEIFKDLAKYFPKYEFIVCQEQDLTKDQYHDILRRAKVMFSANLQETWGIGTFESLASGCLIIVPDRLSYTEMYSDDFKYPSVWTESWESYVKNRKSLIAFIEDKIKKYDSGNLDLLLKKNLNYIRDKYCNFSASFKDMKPGD